jgi:hypothetical protein
MYQSRDIFLENCVVKFEGGLQEERDKKWEGRESGLYNMAPEEREGGEKGGMRDTKIKQKGCGGQGGNKKGKRKKGQRGRKKSTEVVCSKHSFSCLKALLKCFPG